MQPIEIALDGAVPHPLCLDEVQSFLDVLVADEAARQQRTGMAGVLQLSDIQHLRGIDLDAHAEMSDISNDDVASARIYPNMSEAGHFGTAARDQLHALATQLLSDAADGLRALGRMSIQTFVWLDGVSEHILRGVVHAVTHINTALHETYSVVHHPAHEDVRPTYRDTEQNIAAPHGLGLQKDHIDPEYAARVCHHVPVEYRAAAIPVVIHHSGRSSDTEAVTMSDVLQTFAALLFDGTTANIDIRS